MCTFPPLQPCCVFSTTGALAVIIVLGGCKRLSGWFVHFLAQLGNVKHDQTEVDLMFWFLMSWRPSERKKLVQKMCPTCPFDRVGERESKAIWAMSTYTDHISKSGIPNVWFGLVDIIWVVWFCIVKY